MPTRQLSLHVFAASSASLLVAGCDTYSSMSQVAPLQAVPAEASVRAALLEVPAVRSVEREETPTAPCDRGRTAYAFDYQADGVWGSVAVLNARDHHGVLRLSRIWMNHVPTPAEVAETRRVMGQVYASLERRMPDVPPATAAHEELYRVPPQ